MINTESTWNWLINKDTAIDDLEAFLQDLAQDLDFVQGSK